MAKPKTHYEVCSQCTIQETFAAEQPIETHLRTLLEMWSTIYAEELRTVAALFQATTDLAERAQEEHVASKQRNGTAKAHGKALAA